MARILQAHVQRFVLSVALCSATVWTTNDADAQASSLFDQPVSAGAWRDVTKLRPFEVQDLFRLEGVSGQSGHYMFSADGKNLAFTRIRPRADFALQYMFRDAAISDVWVQVGGGETFNLTDGAKDGSGWFFPEWSPDGRHLAMVSTRGGRLRLWIWERSANRLRMLTPRSVKQFDGVHRPFRWLDSRHLLFSVLVDEQQAVANALAPTSEVATEVWARYTTGTESTESVLHSGRISTARTDNGRASHLLLVDLTGTDSLLIDDLASAFWTVSADRSFLATPRFLSNSTAVPERLITANLSALWGIDVRRLNGESVKLLGELPARIVESSLRWSLTQNELAFLGYAGTDLRAYRVNMRDRIVRSHTLRGIDVALGGAENGNTALEWLGPDDLMLFAQELPTKQNQIATAPDWWLIGRNGELRRAAMKPRVWPTRIWPEDVSGTFIAFCDGALWRVRPLGGHAENLTSTVDSVVRIAWPSGDLSLMQVNSDLAKKAPHTQFAFMTKDGRALVLDSRSRKLQPIPLAGRSGVGELGAGESGRLASYSPAAASAIIHVNDRNGLSVWRLNVRTQQSGVLIDTNHFLRQIAEAPAQRIQYVSLDGQALTGWVVLPINYTKGVRYPLLTQVYPGRMATDSSPTERDGGIQSFNIFNPQIAAARGYAILLPSMPSTGEPLNDLMRGVMPAVQQVIDLGIGDPERLFVMGHSFGGFGTLGLVTQTRRFKAAVAIAGLSNLTSAHGSFEGGSRYTDYAHHELTLQAILESGQFEMGGPPWSNWGKYLRNSPLLYAERVHTPVMLMHGDLDFVPMSESEAFFRALDRQGKRVQFVRYWGEGHVLQNPANVKDMWLRIFDWFELSANDTRAGDVTTDASHVR